MTTARYFAGAGAQPVWRVVWNHGKGAIKSWKQPLAIGPQDRTAAGFEVRVLGMIDGLVSGEGVFDASPNGWEVRAEFAPATMLHIQVAPLEHPVDLADPELEPELQDQAWVLGLKDRVADTVPDWEPGATKARCNLAAQMR